MLEFVIQNWSSIIIAFAIMVFSTNAIVEVLKDVFPFSEVHTKLLAAIIGMALTIASIIAYMQINSYDIEWYSILFAVIAGFYVDLGAIEGFDYLYGNYLDKLKTIITNNTK